jgi:hypothetical protein
MSFFLGNFPIRLLKIAAGAVALGFAGKLATPFALRFMTNRAFETVDSNNNGKLDNFELQLAIYELYNLLNKRFPGW